MPVRDVAEVTGFPEMLDGRVKTLHPRIHGGILARRDVPDHLAALAQHGIAPIDLVVVALYPFEATVARPGVTLAEAIEQIDVGGPTMIRAAAKNHASVAVVTDPGHYAAVLEELRATAARWATRPASGWPARRSATAQYDAAIAALPGRGAAEPTPAAAAPFPAALTLEAERESALRYGENPHQAAAFYRTRGGAGRRLARHEAAARPRARLQQRARLLGGAGAAPRVRGAGGGRHQAHQPVRRRAGRGRWARRWRGPRPATRSRSMAASSASTARSTWRSSTSWPASSSRSCSRRPSPPTPWRSCAAPRRNAACSRCRPSGPAGPAAAEYRSVLGGLLAQTTDLADLDPAALETVTRRAPTEAETRALRFAWRVAKHAKSNAIVLATAEQVVGVGAGQMNRLDSARLAVMRAREVGLVTEGAVCASDAFFPFRDGLDVVGAAGATAVIQPGGSLRDAEVIAAADERDMAMVFTGLRHFRH